MLRVGIAGIGFMGWIHWLAWHRIPGVQVVAIATTEPERRAGDWRGIRGNFGPPGELVDVSRLRVCDDVSGLVADPEVDLIDICLPTRSHAEAAMAGLGAGKHVLCEKPLALSLSECDRVIAAAAGSPGQLFVGHVLPFFPELAWALEQVRGGEYGRILGGTFKRIISDPVWLPRFYDPTVIGGPLLDLHVHDAHLIRLLFGMPTAVTSRGRMRGEVAEYAATLFDFPDPSLVVASIMGVIHQQGRPFTHGFEIHLEQATMHFESASLGDQAELMPLKLLTADGRVIRPELPAGDPLDGFTAELTEVRDCVVSGRPSPTLAGTLARDAIAICEMESSSLRRHSGSATSNGHSRTGRDTVPRS